MTLRGSFGEYVVIDPQKLADYMRSSNGPTVRFLLERGEKVKDEAKRLVGVYQPPDAFSLRNRKRRPGTLRDSIVKRIVDIDGLPAVIVGSEDPIALFHHEGTRPHPIMAVRAPGKHLVFFWKKVGHVVAFGPPPRGVNHPGTKPNRFLVNALRVVGGRLA